MGISQLLPLLEKSTRPCHVSEFRGLTVAIDSYCWLHKGARGCALQLAKGEETDLYVNFCLKYVNMLLSHDIKPIMVFDGRNLPAKLKTEDKRRESKKHARQQGIELLRLGKVDEAYKFFKQCIDVNPLMASAVIKECRKLNVDCIVAPYESDAQLAFFNLKGIAECIITEDSDLLLFGCKKVLYKMDLTGNGQLVEAEKINLSLNISPDRYSFDKFRHMCILAGCDYLDSLPGIGLKKALKFISLTAEENPEIFLDRIPRYLNLRRLIVSDDYKENFMVANATFLHQTVFDPVNKQLVPLNPIQTKIEYCRNAGSLFDAEEAFQLALGNLNPLTMKTIDNWQPANSILNDYSIWTLCVKRRRFKNETVTKPRKRKSVHLEATESVNLQYDQQVDQQLEFYKMKAPTEVETDNHSEILPQPDSPILGNYPNNPFIKKKISKFNVTDTQDKVVKSRFFSESLGISKDEIGPDDNKTGMNETTLLTPEESCITALPGKSSFISPLLNTPDENCDSGFSQMEKNDETSDESDETQYLPQIECECILEVDDEEINTNQEHPTLVSVENLPELEPALKKRKLEPQPTKSKKQKKQVTLQHMFKKMRSSNVKN